MDYTSELKRLRHNDGLVFRKTDREIRMAVEERIGEVRASAHARAARLQELAKKYKVENIDAVNRRVHQFRDPYDVDILSYEPVAAVLIGMALVCRMEDDSIGHLKFMFDNVNGTMDLTFNALTLIFSPYSPHTIEREVSLKHAEQRLREHESLDEVESDRKATKRRRRVEEDPYDLSHFLTTDC